MVEGQHSTETRASHSQEMATDSSAPSQSTRISTVPRHQTNHLSLLKILAAPSDAGSHADDELLEIENPSHILQPKLRATSGRSRSNVNDVSEPPVHVKLELLSPDISSNIKLKVIASSQQTMAPATVRLSAYHPAHNLFDFLAAECELGSKAKKVTAVSATYSWNHSPHRLRKHKIDEDWKEFCNDLRSAWDGFADSVKSGLEVTMLLHVEE